MLKWIDVIRFARTGNPVPGRRVVKTDEEWQKLLTPEEFRITRLKGTEHAHSSEMCSLFEPGKYVCLCCGTLLFDANEKFESGTGWPSFTQPVAEDAIAYNKNITHGMVRVETVCSACDAHLGHVFPDGPKPGGLRYCMNAVALKKVESNERKATFGGGCFWYTEAVFTQLEGVMKVESGYSGGKIANPTYREVCSGLTGHAEVIEVTYNPEEISYVDLLSIHLGTQNPTTLNGQGAYTGTQYRSVIFYRNRDEKITATELIAELQAAYDAPIVTEVAPLDYFYKAEDYHQDYYANNSQEGYCQAVIDPKLGKFSELFKSKLKQTHDVEKDVMVKHAGFGGGCHWCTEAVFSSLKGIRSVQQGWIAPAGDNAAFSEGVIVEYDNDTISLARLIAIHLHTHSSTSQHSMRGKYRSAIYTFDDCDALLARDAIEDLQSEFNDPIITEVLPYEEFTLSREELLHYYFSDPQKPFCELYINPKLKLIRDRFSKDADSDKLKHLEQSNN